MYRCDVVFPSYKEGRSYRITRNKCISFIRDRCCIGVYLQSTTTGKLDVIRGGGATAFLGLYCDDDDDGNTSRLLLSRVTTRTDCFFFVARFDPLSLRNTIFLF